MVSVNESSKFVLVLFTEDVELFVFGELQTDDGDIVTCPSA